MSVTEETRLRGRTRWSAAARCPRQAALGLLGAEPEEITDRQRGLFQRGKDAQRFEFRRQLNERRRLALEQDRDPDEAESELIAEKAVPWPAPPALPAGELHTDIVNVPDRLAQEIKCSNAVDSMYDSAMTQLAGEVYYDQDVDAGALIFLSPIDYSRTAVYPLIITEEWVEIIQSIEMQVIEAGKTGELPERTCAKPTDGIGKMCPFIRQCFEGWESPDAIELGDEHAVLVREAWEARQAYERADTDRKTYEAEWKTKTAALSEVGVPVGESLVGGFAVKRIHVAGSEKLAWSKARKSGIVSPLIEDILTPFLSVSGEHDRWSIQKVGPVAEDFGDEAPWSDEDLQGDWA